MSTKAKAESRETEFNELIKIEDNVQLPAGISADDFAQMQADMAGKEGLGTSTNPDDNSTPFLTLLQDMSPEVKKRDPAYVEGAEPGCILNKTTKRLWKLGEACIVIPCYFERMILEWVPREAGGGLVNRSPLLPGGVEETMLKLGGIKITDPKDPTKINWTNDRGNQLIDTRYHFLLVNDNNSWGPALLSLSSTGHKTSKDWMQLMNSEVEELGNRIPPTWFRKYALSSVAKVNNKGEFFRLVANKAGLVYEKRLRDIGEAFYKAASAGSVKIGDEGDHVENVRETEDAI